MDIGVALNFPATKERYAETAKIRRWRARRASALEELGLADNNNNNNNNNNNHRPRKDRNERGSLVVREALNATKLLCKLFCLFLAKHAQFSTDQTRSDTRDKDFGKILD